MAIPPLSSVAAALPTLPTAKPVATEAVGGGFGDMVAKALQSVQQTQTNADALAQSAATGNGDPAEFMIAATQANLATELTVAVRNKAVEAFNDIMRMQI